MTKHHLWKNWKIWLLAIFVLGSLFFMIKIDENGLGHNLTLGTEFKGGTLFQLQLAEPATASQLSEIKIIVEKRLNPAGIKDVTVSNTGDQIILAQVAETDPDAVENLQALLLKQGKFESFLNGKKVFDGAQIVQVIENPQQGYGAHPTGIGDQYAWTLPFLLNDTAAHDFTQAAFHQCTQTGFSGGEANWDCEATFFFIDRPSNAMVVYPASVRSSDAGKLDVTDTISLPTGVTITDIIENSELEFLEPDVNGFTPAQLALLSTPPEGVKKVMYPSTLNESLVAQLKASTTLEVVSIDVDPLTPWIVDATGLRDVISLSPGVTGNSPFIADAKDAKPMQFLTIQGTAANAAEAKQRLDDLRVLLKSGALPIPIISINKQTISAELGEQFLSNVWVMGILSFIVVEIIIFIRYRKLRLVGPVSLMGISEVIMILGFAAIVKWNLDLASMAGILAAVGTGVDSAIIMTDEILHGGEEEHTDDEKSMTARAKRAFFIVAASAATAIAVMLPMIIFGSGIGKLAGFALTTIVGVLLGVLISRPAFQEIIKHLLVPKAKEEAAAAAQTV